MAVDEQYSSAMDTVDRQIIAELEAEGRLSITELAQRVKLSVSPCHRRLRELQRTGAIRGYRAVVDPGAWGPASEALFPATLIGEATGRFAESEGAFPLARSGGEGDGRLVH